MHRLLVGALLTVALTTRPAPAQHMNEKDSPCAGVSVTSDLTSCLVKAGEAADARLNSIFRSIREKVDGADGQRLVAAERLWIQYRDANCTAERELYQHGTGGPPAYLACMEAMTRARTKELEVTYAVAAMRFVSAFLIAASVATAADPSRVDAIFAPLTDAKSPGVAVLVRKDGKTIEQRGYGVRDLRTMTPIDGRTNFRLASFTKQFTAMAVMLLVGDGKLRYDESLTEIFSDFPDYGRTITVRHLLTHTGGLPDYEELMENGPWSETFQIQDKEVLTLLKQGKPKFAAGTSWSYSNSGYVVLGSIVAKVSGMPLGEFWRQRIFAPLHMDRTLAYIKGSNTVPDRAFGHTKRAAAFVETDQSSSSATLGDGGIYSNLEDLAKWDEALEKHTLLAESKMKAALTPVRLADGSAARWPSAPGDDNLNPGKPVAYGFGWFLDAYNGRPRMWHEGSTRGFGTVIERFTTERLTIVLLCNRTDLDPIKLSLRVADLFR